MTSLEPWEAALLDFMKIYSPTGEEARAGTFLLNLLRQLFPEALITTQEVEPNRFNVCCCIESHTLGTPLILSSHFDTVPGELPVRYDSDALHGRGACDAKGQIIAQLWGAKRAVDSGLRGIALCYVVGEETDALGARKLVSNLPKAKYLLNGEPTENTFVSLSWGAIDVTLTTSGTAQHSSLGTTNSASHKLIADLHSLLSIQDDRISINVGLLSGGSAPNTVADESIARLCIRYATDTELLKDLIRSTLRYSTPMFIPPLVPLTLHVPEPYRNSAIEVKFGSDCSIFCNAVEHVMLRGPGTIRDAHTAQEKIERRSLATAIEDIATLIAELVNSSQQQPIR